MPEPNFNPPFREVYKPSLFHAQDETSLLKLQELQENPSIRIVDFFLDQLKELIQCTQPARRFSESEMQSAISDRLSDLPVEQAGTWVHYPWDNCLVHILDEEDFISLRTNRNRNKITDDEQARLRTKVVGIAGLSVGRSVALTLAQERIAGEIRLADFDVLELSNLNRIRAGLKDLGMNKAVSAAREIAGIDPYLEVKVFKEGIQPENMDAFFLNGGQMDLFIEECDSVEIKIKSRLRARELGIPVLMDTSDRGMLDVERFDLQPNRPLLHGWIDHLNIDELRPGMTNDEKIPFLLPMLGVDNMSPRMKASVLEMGQSVHTWPQLATSVNLGGAITADTARRILIGEFNGSGRWYIDTSELINEVEDIEIPKKTETDSTPVVIPISEILRDFQPSSDAIPIPEESLQKILEAGAIAPSAGNMQPWHFHLQDGIILLLHDTKRSESAFDMDHMIAHIGLGTCVENMVLEARKCGLELHAKLFPGKDERLIAALHSTGKRPERTDEISEMIGLRVTDRTIRGRTELDRDRINELLTIETDPSTRLRFFGDEIRLTSIAELCGMAERLRAMNKVGHEELFHHELRWTAEDVERTRDGLDIDTLEISDSAKAGLMMAADHRAIDLLNKWQKGNVFAQGSFHAVKNSHGVILITTKGRDARSRVIGGRTVERMWLQASRLGYAAHPVSAPIFLTEHNEIQQGSHLSATEQKTLSGIQKSLKRIFDLAPEEFPLFLLRIGPGGQPSKRSLRRHLKDMVSGEIQKVLVHD